MRILLTPRWLAYGLVALLLATAMVFLGRWQWSRYELRHEINARIAASTVMRPVELHTVLPDTDTRATESVAWTRVSVAGVYDPAHQVLIRGRTVNGWVGYEVVTPLVLDGGNAVLIDRGWVPPSQAGFTEAPDVPAPPAGRQTVSGRVHLSESGGGAVAPRLGHLETRRVSVDSIAEQMPYPLFDAYLLADEGTAGARGLTSVRVPSQKDWLNFGYAFQWWIFAAGVLVAYAWIARKEAEGGRSEGVAEPEQIERAR